METKTKRKVIVSRSLDVRLYQDYAIEMTDEEVAGLTEAMRTGSEEADAYLADLYIKGELISSGTSETDVSEPDVVIYAYDKDGML